MASNKGDSDGNNDPSRRDTLVGDIFVKSVFLVGWLVDWFVNEKIQNNLPERKFPRKNKEAVFFVFVVVFFVATMANTGIQHSNGYEFCPGTGLPCWDS